MPITPSNISLNRAHFSRNRHREKEYDNVFSKAHKSLSFLSQVFFLVIFPPAIAISSLFSNAVLISTMNIFLSIAYCAKFIQRISEQEVSLLEMATTLFFLSLTIGTSLYWAPAISLISLIDVIGCINLIATGINSFFLVRDILLPPVQGLIHDVLNSFGYEITTSFFNKSPLTLKHDSHVLDRLLRKFYKHDSHSPEFKEQEIRPFNNMLSTLTHYINKYNKPFLGNLTNRERITTLENAVSQLIIHGNTDSTTLFIRKKIDFKTSTLNHLLKAKQEFIIDGRKDNFTHRYRFFNLSHKIPIDNQDELHAAGVTLFDDAINRQKQKIETLQACLPF